MLSSNDVREQNIEFESKFTSLLEKYKGSILDGSQDVRCNAAGCYISYTLTNLDDVEHIWIDFPDRKGSTGYGFTIDSPDGTVRYVDFILSQ